VINLCKGSNIFGKPTVFQVRQNPFQAVETLGQQLRGQAMFRRMKPSTRGAYMDPELT